MMLLSSARIDASVATRGGGFFPHSTSAIVSSPAPEIRMTPTPPRPGAVAMAAIVSSDAFTVFVGSGLGVVAGFSSGFDHPGYLPLLGY